MIEEEGIKEGEIAEEEGEEDEEGFGTEIGSKEVRGRTRFLPLELDIKP